ncbi:leucine-rich repeat-containing protein 74A-like [Pecten maximus]|uniref:leucine-rich repeat-containing protein 74A-like n=1 Tax=Pecten maximus TaxID=6579 RepID=UPI0014585F0A|nr:leucine-rich repeat-containing protein 74A-like [Pecten maximus]
MPGTGSAGRPTLVKPPRLQSSTKLPKGLEDGGPPETNRKAPSRIGSAVSVASTSRMSEKDAAGLITDLTRLKAITHDIRIPAKELPHRKAIDIGDTTDDGFEFTDSVFQTEVPLPEEGFDVVERWQQDTKVASDEESNIDDDIEDVFGEDVISVSSLGTNPDDDADKYDTDLEEDLTNLPDTEKQDEDTTPKGRYLRICEDMGIQPASYFIKHMSETELVMKFHGLGPVGMKAMAESLMINTILEKIDLEGNYILGEGTSHLTRVLKENVYVTELVLTDNKMGTEGAKAICELLSENKTIIHLNLSGNDIEDTAAEYFYEMLTRNAAIKTLLLQHNSFEEKGAEWFAMALNENVSLESLDLSWCHFQTKGCVMIVEALRENVGLKYFDISMNGFGLEGAKAMEETLKENKYLIKLNLSYCRIPLEGTPHLAAGLQTNDTLEELNIGFNPLSAEGGYAVLVGIERNAAKTLKMIDFGNLMIRKNFKDLCDRLREDRPIKIKFGGVLSDQPRAKKKEDDPLTKLLNDPLNKLKRFVEEAGYRMIDLLKQFDTDNSWSISLEELKEGVRKTGIDLSDPEINELMKRLDKDGNGEIDFSELIEGDNENRLARREVKKYVEEMQQKEEQKEKLASGADPKSYMQLLEDTSA